MAIAAPVDDAPEEMLSPLTMKFVKVLRRAMQSKEEVSQVLCTHNVCESDCLVCSCMNQSCLCDNSEPDRNGAAGHMRSEQCSCREPTNELTEGLYSCTVLNWYVCSPKLVPAGTAAWKGGPGV